MPARFTFCLPVCILMAIPTTVRAADPSPEKAAILARLEKMDADVTQDRDGNVIAVVFGCASTVRDDDLLLLKAFPKLERLTIIGEGDVTDTGIAHLKGLKLKKLLVISEAVTIKGIESLATLTELEDLQLNGVPLNAAGLDQLKKLPNLKALRLRNNDLTDDRLVHFAGFPKLESVRITNGQVTEAGLAKLRELLPKVAVTR